MPVLLIVDDEELVRSSLQLLFRHDYLVLAAASGPKAIELAQEHPLAVTLLDLEMQEMPGMVVFEKLKAFDPLIEIIILTAHETLETARRAVRLGAFDYITKPFDLSAIRATVAEAVERYRKNRHLQAVQEELRKQQLQQEKLRTKNEIYAAILHDVNNPLTFVAGITEVLSGMLAEKDTLLRDDDLAFVRQQVSQINRHALHCADICRRYLGYSPEQPSATASVDVLRVLRDVEQLVRCHPDRQENELIVQAPPESLAARANGIDLVQILLNLVINALQCTPRPHRVELSARRLDDPQTPEWLAERPRSLFLNREGLPPEPPWISFTVQDNGPGIAPELLPKIFDPYFTTKQQGKNTGLGLAIVLRCVRDNRGAIHVQSQVSPGTTFTVLLPSVTG